MVLSSVLMSFYLYFSQLNSISMTFATIFHTNYGMYFLTVLIMLLIYFGLYGIFNRFFFSTALFYVLSIVFAVANRLKIIYRAEPLLPSDLAFFNSSRGLLSMISLKLTLEIIFGLLFIVVICLFLQKKFGKTTLFIKWPIRFIMILLFGTVLSGFYTVNNQNSLTKKILTKEGYTSSSANLMWDTNNNGPLITFLTNIHLDVMEKPSNYNQEKIDSIVKKYQGVATDINENRPNADVNKQTVIFVLSESLSDPSRVPNVKINQDPLPNIRRIKSENTSGLMLSSGYGGGTANMEYMALTGMAVNQFSNTLRTPFVQLVTKQVNPENISNQFEISTAIHPYLGTFYNRTGVYESFGIKNFKNLKTKGHSALKYTAPLNGGQWVSDKSVYNDVLLQVEQGKHGQFINVVTMQNHMPYNNYYPDNTFTASGKGVGQNASEVANYAKGISYTDASTKDFLNALDTINKPITVVLYGDHLPGIYSGNESAVHEIPEHETDYFIYSNKYAIDHNMGTKKIISDTHITDPNGFIPLVYQQMKQKVSPFYALLTEIQKDTPAMAKSTINTSGNLYIDKHTGKQISYNKLSYHQRQLLEDYRLVQYDMTAGKNYSGKLGFTK